MSRPLRTVAEELSPDAVEAQLAVVPQWLADIIALARSTNRAVRVWRAVTPFGRCIVSAEVA